MKIAVCVPVHGDTRHLFTASVVNLVMHSIRALDCEIEFLMQSASIVSVARNRLVDDARRVGADWILWIDADQTFPPNALERLLATGKELVGCNIATRFVPPQPTARRFKDGAWEPVVTLEHIAAAEEIEQVNALGLGLCLMKTSLLDGIPEPLFRFEDAKGGYATEEEYLFRQLFAKGVPLYVDHWLSWQVGHVALRVVTNGHIQADIVAAGKRARQKQD